MTMMMMLACGLCNLLKIRTQRGDCFFNCRARPDDDYSMNLNNKTPSLAMIKSLYNVLFSLSLYNSETVAPRPCTYVSHPPTDRAISCCAFVPGLTFQTEIELTISHVGHGTRTENQFPFIWEVCYLLLVFYLYFSEVNYLHLLAFIHIYCFRSELTRNLRHKLNLACISYARGAGGC